jgi:hypothetical protein
MVPSWCAFDDPISAGVYGFQADRDRRYAVVNTSHEGIDRIVFCCFSKSLAAHHISELAALRENNQP